MSSGDENPGRRITNMQELLRFCVQGTAAESPAVQLDPERRQWLEEALKSMSVDIVQEMLEQIANIRKELENLKRESSEDIQQASVSSICDSVDLLLERTEDLDIASDFEKIGGFQILCPLLESVSHPELQVKGCELVGELVQNHIPCQTAALSNGILEILVNILENNSASDEVKVKALFAISCLVRSNSEAQNVFVNKLDGFSVIIQAMRPINADSRLRTKSAFLLSSLISERSDFKEPLFRMGFVDQFVGLLHQSHDSSHEHLLSSLLGFVTNYPPALQECLRPELGLKKLLLAKIEETKGKEEFQEVEMYCKDFLKLISDSDSNIMMPVANDSADR